MVIGSEHIMQWAKRYRQEPSKIHHTAGDEFWKPTPQTIWMELSHIE